MTKLRIGEKSIMKAQFYVYFYTYADFCKFQSKHNFGVILTRVFTFKFVSYVHVLSRNGDTR